MAGCAGCSKVRLALLPKGTIWSSRDEGGIDNKHLKTEEDINQAIRLGEFIKQGLGSLNRSSLARLTKDGGTETLALYSLRKYRHLKVSFAEHRALRPRPPFTTPSQRMYPPPDPLHPHAR